MSKSGTLLSHKKSDQDVFVAQPMMDALFTKSGKRGGQAGAPAGFNRYRVQFPAGAA